VKDSKLELSNNILKRKNGDANEKEKKDDENERFPEIKNGMFNPLINKSHQLVLYVKFKFRGVTKIFIFDPKSSERVILPDDVMS
jgi:hypothetical protein